MDRRERGLICCPTGGGGGGGLAVEELSVGVFIGDGMLLDTDAPPGVGVPGVDDTFDVA